MIENKEWKKEIMNAFNGEAEDASFLDVIWEMSLTAFDKDREVQVVVDKNDSLFINYGTGSFVDFVGVEKELEGANGLPLTLPIKCWIHTHPFGSAYFSSTDWSTIRCWELHMESAIVLGDNERMKWVKGNKTHTLFFKNYDIPDWSKKQRTVFDYMEGEE